jgi:hypothetical protein
MAIPLTGRETLKLLRFTDNGSQMAVRLARN